MQAQNTGQSSRGAGQRKHRRDSTHSSHNSSSSKTRQRTITGAQGEKRATTQGGADSKEQHTGTGVRGQGQANKGRQKQEEGQQGKDEGTE